MSSIVIVTVSRLGRAIAEIISGETDSSPVVDIHSFDKGVWESFRNIVFIGAMGICVRSIAGYLKNKYTDPAVVCVDSSGKFVIPVVSGHIGGANELARRIARILGAIPVVTTQSDNIGMWALDTLGTKYGWKTEAGRREMNDAVFSFVNGEPVGLLIDVSSDATRELMRTKPSNVEFITGFEDCTRFRLIIAVTPFIYECDVPVLYYRPPVLDVGVGCRKNCGTSGVGEYIERVMKANRLSPLSIHRVATIELKKDEPLMVSLAERWTTEAPCVFSSEELAHIEVANPSEKVHEVTGVWGVAESAALAASGLGKLVLEKQKGKLNEGDDFTFAVSVDREATRCGHIEIVGAGPGDPELVSVRGKRFLEEADLILYAGSLVPEELTYYAKPGCVIRSSAGMNLGEQFELMKNHYDRGEQIVRLHTGDPCIYGAIQEQMAFFDKYGMSYHITPGISSFQAAAAELRSQFTIPEKVQTIILTRGEGRTPMPEREKLHLLARSRSTMCIYLSAAIADEVQAELMQAYPPETPVAACYKLTWKEQRIYRGELKDLAKIVRDNNLTLTTLLVVGDAIDNREGLSRLYDDSFSHLFRK